MKEPDKLSIFNDIEIMKIQEEDVRERLFIKKIDKIKELYYKTE